MSSNNVVISIRDLSHTYKRDNRHVLENIDLDIHAGESVILLGSSGSGKSTLLRCINRLVTPTKGSVVVYGNDVVRASKKEIRDIRRHIGMIFQSFNLINRMSVLDNVLVGRLGYLSTVRSALGLYTREDIDEAMHALKRVGLVDYGHSLAMNLSEGQRQRVAIARALTQRPQILLADEPVSNLDPLLMHDIMKLLKSICEENHITSVISLHLLELAQQYGTRTVGITNKRAIVFEKTHLSKDEIQTIYGQNER